MVPPTDSGSYSFGFTAASLRTDLVAVMAEQFARYGNWAETRQAILSTNALQCRSAASGIRLERELRQRLETLTAPQLALLARTTADGRACLAWLASVKRHSFLFDFAAETLREKLATHDPTLRSSDYERFVGEKAVTHPALHSFTPTTLAKIRAVLVRMLREAGLLAKGTDLGQIQRPVVPPEVESVIRADHPSWMAAFLVPDSGISSR